MKPTEIDDIDFLANFDNILDRCKNGEHFCIIDTMCNGENTMYLVSVEWYNKMKNKED